MSDAKRGHRLPIGDSDERGKKDYDRDTSMETIKLILKLGFKISK